MPTLPSLDYLVDRIWEELHLVKIYTKKRGDHPDLSDPICLRKGATIEVSASSLIAEDSLLNMPYRMFAMESTGLSLPTSVMALYGVFNVEPFKSF